MAGPPAGGRGEKKGTGGSRGARENGEHSSYGDRAGMLDPVVALADDLDFEEDGHVGKPCYFPEKDGASEKPEQASGERRSGSNSSIATGEGEEPVTREREGVSEVNEGRRKEGFSDQISEGGSIGRDDTSEGTSGGQRGEEREEGEEESGSSERNDGMNENGRRKGKDKEESSTGSMELQMEDEARASKNKYKHEDDTMPSWRKHKKHFFILSNAGKPIYSRYGDEQKLAGFSGILQAILSFVENEGDKIRFIRAGQHQILFLVRGPLYLVSISATGEPTSMLRDQLDLLHGQMMMILTSAVERSLARSPKFDMRPLLGGTAGVFVTLTRSFSRDYATVLKAYACLRLPVWARHAAGQALIEAATSAPLFYALLLCGTKVIAFAAPRKQFFHVDDLFLLSNFITSSESFRMSETYSPVCLPRYNSAAFLYAYVKYLVPQACLVLLTSDPSGFYALKECRASVESSLCNSGALREIIRSAEELSSLSGGLRVEDLPSSTSPSASLSVREQLSSGAEVGSEDEAKEGERGEGEEEGLFEQVTDVGLRLSIEMEDEARSASGEAAYRNGVVGRFGSPGGLLHFMYRKSALEQYVVSKYSPPLTTKKSQKRLLRAYQRLRASMLGEGGPSGGQKMQYRRDDHFVLLAWRTHDFEIFAAFDPLADKRSSIAICNRVTEWLRGFEEEVFSRMPFTFSS